MCKSCQDTIQTVEAPWHIVLMIINILAPGLGTMYNGCACCCSSCGVKECNWAAFGIGLLQSMSACFLVGWIWSIWWGVLIYQKTEAVKNGDYTPAKEGGEE